MIWFWLFTAVFAAEPRNEIDLKMVQPIVIEESFEYAWMAEKPIIARATILVIRIDEDKTGLPQVGAPVLYVGPVPAARINPGTADKHIVVFVPGHPDLSETRVFWGPDHLPERVTKQIGTEAEASAQGPTFPVPKVASVTKPVVHVANQSELYGQIAPLIDQYAPGDGSFADSIRVTLGL